MHRTADHFLRHFYYPLIVGGPLHVGRPQDARSWAQLKQEAFLSGEMVQRVEEARQERAAALWLYTVPTPLDDVSLALAIGVHNLLFLSRSELKRWTVRNTARHRVEEYTQRLLEIAPPDTAEEALARHTVLGNLFSLERTDVEVEYWAAVLRFQGQTPPTRLLRWPRLRRVQQRQQKIIWIEEAVLTAGQLDLLQQLLRASPLSDLLAPRRAKPDFYWLPLLPFLRWPALCRLVCHCYLADGLHEVGPVLARAFWELLAQDGVSPTALRFLLAMFFYLVGIACLTEELELWVPAPTDDLLEHLSPILVAAAQCDMMPQRDTLIAPELYARLTTLISLCQQRYGASINALGEKLHQATRA